MSIIETFKADAVAVWDAIEPTLLSDLLTIGEDIIAGILTGGVSVLTGAHIGDVATGILNRAGAEAKLDIISLEPALLQSVVSTLVATKAN